MKRTTLQAVVLAAGRGTRMAPLTNTTHKALLPVGDRPILGHLLQRLDGVVDSLIVVVNHFRWKVQDYISSETALPVEFVEQSELRGTGDALLRCRDLIKGSSFLCLNADVLISTDVLTQLAAGKADARTLLTVTEVADPRPYGVVEVEGDRITGIEEKPDRPRSQLINAGAYRFPTQVFDALDRCVPSPRGELELPDAIRILLGDGGGGVVHEKSGWIDIGRPWDLLQANRMVLEQHPGFARPADLPGKGPIVMAPDVKIGPGTMVDGPVVIGPGCEIGPNSKIEAFTTLGHDVYIGSGSVVSGSVIGAGSVIRHHCVVLDSVIGADCNLGSGTRVANERFDRGSIRLVVKGANVDSGLRQLGVVMGDNVRTGIQAGINVGTIIGEGSMIGPGAIAKGWLAPGTRLS